MVFQLGGLSDNSLMEEMDGSLRMWRGSHTRQISFHLPPAPCKLALPKCPIYSFQQKRISSKKINCNLTDAWKESSGPLDPREEVRGASVFIFEENLIKLWWGRLQVLLQVQRWSHYRFQQSIGSNLRKMLLWIVAKDLLYWGICTDVSCWCFSEWQILVT